MKHPSSLPNLSISFCICSVINNIFDQVEEHINSNSLIADFNMTALPDLYDHFVKLIKHLVCLNFVISLVKFSFVPASIQTNNKFFFFPNLNSDG